MQNNYPPTLYAPETILITAEVDGNVSSFAEYWTPWNIDMMIVLEEKWKDHQNIYNSSWGEDERL